MDISKRIEVRVGGKVVTDYKVEDLGNNFYKILVKNKSVIVEIEDCDVPVVKKPVTKKPTTPTVSNEINYDKDFTRPSLEGYDVNDPCFEPCVEPLLKKI